MPGVDGWEAIEDPQARTRHGLRVLYAFWEANEEMTANVLRDARGPPGGRGRSASCTGAAAARARSARRCSARGRGAEQRLAATVDLAMSFRAWQSLVRGAD